MKVIASPKDGKCSCCNRPVRTTAANIGGGFLRPLPWCPYDEVGWGPDGIVYHMWFDRGLGAVVARPF